MVMTQMLMRWKPRLPTFRGRRSKTQTLVNTAVPADPTGPPAPDDKIDYQVEVERRGRLQARAEQNVQRFVGLRQAEARVLGDGLGLEVRFFRLGEGLTDDYCAGRVTAQVEDGVVITARALG